MFKKRRRDADSQIVRKLIVIRFLVLALIPNFIGSVTAVPIIVSVIAIYYNWMFFLDVYLNSVCNNAVKTSLCIIHTHS